MILAYTNLLITLDFWSSFGNKLSLPGTLRRLKITKQACWPALLVRREVMLNGYAMPLSSPCAFDAIKAQYNHLAVPYL